MKSQTKEFLLSHKSDGETLFLQSLSKNEFEKDKENWEVFWLFGPYFLELFGERFENLNWKLGRQWDTFIEG